MGTHEVMIGEVPADTCNFENISPFPMMFVCFAITSLPEMVSIVRKVTENVNPLLGATHGSTVFKLTEGNEVDTLIPHPGTRPDHMILIFREFPYNPN